MHIIRLTLIIGIIIGNRIGASEQCQYKLVHDNVIWIASTPSACGGFHGPHCANFTVQRSIPPYIVKEIANAKHARYQNTTYQPTIHFYKLVDPDSQISDVRKKLAGGGWLLFAVGLCAIIKYRKELQAGAKKLIGFNSNAANLNNQKLRS